VYNCIINVLKEDINGISTKQKSSWISLERICYRISNTINPKDSKFGIGAKPEAKPAKKK